MEFDFTGMSTVYGILCTDGRTIEPGTFDHQAGQIVPLVWRHGHKDMRNVVGHGVLEVSEDPPGMRILGKFNSTKEGIRAKMLVRDGNVRFLSIWANEVVEHANGEDQSSVTYGVIREVSLVLVGANSGASIDDVIRHSDDPLNPDFVVLDGIIVHNSDEHEIHLFTDDERTNFEHYGRKGMKWGVINEDTGGSSSSSGGGRSGEEGNTRGRAAAEKKRREAAQKSGSDKKKEPGAAGGSSSASAGEEKEEKSPDAERNEEVDALRKTAADLRALGKDDLADAIDKEIEELLKDDLSDEEDEDKDKEKDDKKGGGGGGSKDKGDKEDSKKLKEDKKKLQEKLDSAREELAEKYKSEIETASKAVTALQTEAKGLQEEADKQQAAAKGARTMGNIKEAEKLDQAYAEAKTKVDAVTAKLTAQQSLIADLTEKTKEWDKKEDDKDDDKDKKAEHSEEVESEDIVHSDFDLEIYDFLSELDEDELNDLSHFLEDKEGEVLLHIANDDSVIEHYGVKGMRWGVRRVGSAIKSQTIYKEAKNLKDVGRITARGPLYAAKMATQRDKERIDFLASSLDKAYNKSEVRKLQKQKKRHIDGYESDAKQVEKEGASSVSKLQKQKKRHIDGYESDAKQVEKEGSAKVASLQKQKKRHIDGYESDAKSEKSQTRKKDIRDEAKAQEKEWDKAITKEKTKTKKIAKDIRDEAKAQEKEWDKAITKEKTKTKKIAKDIRDEAKAQEKEWDKAIRKKEAEVKTKHSEEIEPGDILHELGTEDQTIGMIISSLTEEQKDLFNIIIHALGKGEKTPPSQQTNDALLDGPTVQEVFDSLTEEQRNTLYYVAGEISPTLSQEDYNTMPTNIFENTNNDEDKVLAHEKLEQVQGILQSAIKGKPQSLRALFAEQDVSIAHSVTDIDNMFPDAKGVQPGGPLFWSRPMEWVEKVLTRCNHRPFSRIKSSYADLTGAAARAKGFVSPNQKAEEVIAVLKRTTTPQTIYKLQKLDRDDILDITDFDVVMWLKVEMRMMLREELARAILISDGRANTGNDAIVTTNVRPIYNDDAVYTISSIYNDVANEQDLADFTAAETVDLIDYIADSMKDYRGKGSPTFYCQPAVLTKLLLVRDDNNQRLHRTVQELADALRVSAIVEVPPMAAMERTGEVDPTGLPAGTYDIATLGIIVNLSDYVIGVDRGGQTSFFEDFDIDYNKYTYLYETRLSGALVSPKSAIAIELVTAKTA